MSSVAVRPTRVPLDLIDVGQNARELDQEHVQALASSIALRGMIVPLVVRADGERFRLIAGFHRYAAAQRLDLSEVEITIREQDGTSADSAAENVVRKQLTPLQEAQAVKHMLDEGYTLDGAATVLGWSPKLVSARAKILELPALAQRLIGEGELPVSAVGTVAKIAAVSPELCQATLEPIAAGELSGEQLPSNPGWLIGHAIRGGAKVFAAYLATLSSRDVQELKLAKKTQRAYTEAQELHRKLDRHAYGPPAIHFTDAEVDQARAAGVLIEFDHGTPVITDRALFRELARQAIERTLTDLQAQAQRAQSQRQARDAQGRPQRTPAQEHEAEHRATLRQLSARAHNTNLDLGVALLGKLATVDPADIDVARFFAYGLLGPDRTGFLGKGDHTVATLAANGVRLVFEQHRTTTTPTLKSGKPGVTKVSYGEPADTAAWMWKFLDGARNAGELYGRAMVLFAAQHYVTDLVLPASQRRRSVLPRSHKDLARTAFERVVGPLLPATHVQLEREARAYLKRQERLTGASAQKRTSKDADVKDPQAQHDGED